MSTTEADALREQARLEERKREESFERSDTDGSLSQWAHDQTARRLWKLADLAEQNGMAEFPALFRDGVIVPAKIIDGHYGAVWMLLDEAGEPTGEEKRKHTSDESMHHRIVEVHDADAGASLTLALHSLAHGFWKRNDRLSYRLSHRLAAALGCNHHATAERSRAA